MGEIVEFRFKRPYYVDAKFIEFYKDNIAYVNSYMKFISSLEFGPVRGYDIFLARESAMSYMMGKAGIYHPLQTLADDFAQGFIDE